MTARTRFIINRLIDELSNIWFTDDELTEVLNELEIKTTMQTLTKYLDLEREVTYEPIYLHVRYEIAKEDPHVVQDPYGGYLYKRTTYFINGRKTRV